MNQLRLISTGLHRTVNIRVGSESVIRLRRTLMDLEHEVKIVTCKFSTDYEVRHLSGSKAEGFRSQNSDVDLMYLICDARVIFSLSQLSGDNEIVFLAECDGVRPGYARLRLITESNNSKLKDSCFLYEHGCYCSSERWREQFLYDEGEDFIHGPCVSGVRGMTEFDFAHCIRSECWPYQALGCIQRMRQTGWPSHEILTKLIRQGSVLVPVGPRTSPVQGMEWRISFILAEKTLIHNMTHSQFILYALLKIFLKEAIDVEKKEDLLSSYLLKTVLFWSLSQQQQEELNEGNFLQNFWKCFQTLIQFVMFGYCPNFFIPENNMFLGKIEGTAQKNLLLHLTSLYGEGYYCLLRCPSVNEVMLRVFLQPEKALIVYNDQKISSKTDIDTDLITEISDRRSRLCNSQRSNYASLLRMVTLCTGRLSEDELIALKAWIKMFISDLSIILSKYYVQRVNVSNQQHYNSQRIIIQVARLSSTDAVHNLLYLSVALYQYGNTSAVIKILTEVKRRMEHPCLMYPWNISMNKYRKAGGETTSVASMMKTVVANPLSTILETCIPILSLEYTVASPHRGIVIPPLVCANILLFLCYQNEQNDEQANAILEELSTLVYYDEEYHISERDRAISWQLLGICLEMRADYWGAYNAYATALQQTWCQIENASLIRIITTTFSFLQSGGVEV